MLARYTMHRGRRPADDPLPEGVRIDTRRHTKHFLRPPRDGVDAYLADPSEAAWRRFEADYRRLLAERFAEDRAPFDALAEQAMRGDVYLGCSCPTRRNPDVEHCHTVLALRFMAGRFKKLEVVLPGR